MRPLVRRTAAVLGVALLSTPAAAHGVATVATGLPFPLVVVGVVAVSLLGGGLVLVAYGRLPRPTRGAAPLLVATLGVAALALAVTRSMAVAFVGTAAGIGVVYLARDAAITDCGACADAALGAVTLHRGLEGVVLATVYAADAALGLLGAAVVAAHAAVETAAVGSLYAATKRHAVAAVCLAQAGFVGGVAAGRGVVGAVPPAVDASVLALVGGVLLAVGTREGYRRYAGRRSISAA
jgi:hypothetical protein